jgi:hypothetical protein
MKLKQQRKKVTPIIYVTMYAIAINILIAGRVPWGAGGWHGEEGEGGRD